MESNTSMTYVELGLRLSLVGVFLASGLAKARTIDDVVLMWTRLFERVWPAKKGWAPQSAWGLVVVEVTTGIALLFQGTTRVFSLLLAVGLLAGFTVLALFSARNLIKLHCACFGRASTPLGWRHVWRNSTLLAFGGTALFLAPDNAGKALNVGGVGVSVAAAVVVTLIAFFYDEITDLLSGNW
ncbi:MauE/DoxX family redox-associated membrane protein [Streptomyces sp. NPDC048751]|uniref:MauE/DoxX family redox-associated membrane protein n=1 Tax=Streptomyces sp. NPDC048751 TaxID=3365591 RepID=UPI00370FD7B9